MVSMCTSPSRTCLPGCSRERAWIMAGNQHGSLIIAIRCSPSSPMAMVLAWRLCGLIWSDDRGNVRNMIEKLLPEHPSVFDLFFASVLVSNCTQQASARPKVTRESSWLANKATKWFFSQIFEESNFSEWNILLHRACWLENIASTLYIYLHCVHLFTHAGMPPHSDLTSEAWGNPHSEQSPFHSKYPHASRISFKKMRLTETYYSLTPCNS